MGVTLINKLPNLRILATSWGNSMNYKTGLHLYVFAVLFVVIGPPAVYAADFYATHAGQSLNEVRQTVRAYKKGLPPQEAITVWLEKGTHYLDAPVGFDEKDSGSEEYPIVYRSKPGEQVRISGGRKIEGFVPVTDEAILSRLEVSVHPHIVQADLSGWTGVDFGEPVPVYPARRIPPIWQWKPIRIIF